MAKVQLEQWVNLNKDAKWVEDEIKSVERVGELHFEVAFTGAKLANFKIRVTKSDGIDYNAAEAARNKNFRIAHGAGSETNLGKKKVQLQRDVSLPMAGGNEYIVRVQYKKKALESTKAVVVRRKLFYYSVKMDAATVPAAEKIGDPSTMLTTMESDYWQPAKNYYVKLKKRGDATMAFTKSLVLNEQDENQAAVGNAWGNTRAALLRDGKAALSGNRPDLQKRKPFCFVSIWCNYIPGKGKEIVTQTGQTWTGTAYQPGSVSLPSWFGKLFNYTMPTQTLYITIGNYLWHGLNDTDDANQHWLESVELFFVDTNNARTRIAIPNNRVSIADGPSFAFGGHKLLKVDLTDADMQGIRRRIVGEIKGTFQFRVKVRTVVGWTLGFAVPGFNVIVVCDKATWAKVSDVDKTYVLNHEFGHKIGMTAQGGQANTFNNENAANTPDSPGTLYGNINTGPTSNNQGHTGNHCQKGATWTQGAYNATTQQYAGTWTGVPQCVMFGMSGVWNGGTLNMAPRQYCSDCEPVVRKLDLGTSMVGFASCVTD